MYATPQFWHHFPDFPLVHFSVLFQWESLLLVAGLTAGGYVVLRLRRQWSYLKIGILCLALNWVGFTLARIVLYHGTAECSEVGRWLAFAILWMFYAAGFSAGFAVLELWPNNPLARLEKYFNHFCFPKITITWKPQPHS